MSKRRAVLACVHQRGLSLVSQARSARSWLSVAWLENSATISGPARNYLPVNRAQHDVCALPLLGDERIYAARPEPADPSSILHQARLKRTISRAATIT